MSDKRNPLPAEVKRGRDHYLDPDEGETTRGTATGRRVWRVAQQWAKPGQPEKVVFEYSGNEATATYLCNERKGDTIEPGVWYPADADPADLLRQVGEALELLKDRLMQLDTLQGDIDRSAADALAAYRRWKEDK